MITRKTNKRIQMPGYQTSTNRSLEYKKFYERCSALMDQEAKLFPDFKIFMNIDEGRITFQYELRDKTKKAVRPIDGITSRAMEESLRRIKKTFQGFPLLHPSMREYLKNMMDSGKSAEMIEFEEDFPSMGI